MTKAEIQLQAIATQMVAIATAGREVSEDEKQIFIHDAFFRILEDLRGRM